MKHAKLFGAATLAAGVLAIANACAADTKSTPADQKSVSITIYNDNLGLVKDVRVVTLKTGAQNLWFEGVAAQIDPTTESIVQNALVRLSRGRTAVTIAHRLSTAEAADLVVVVEQGRIADAAPHAVLIERCAPYQRLHASWTAHLATAGGAR